jgi:hypothetical protein
MKRSSSKKSLRDDDGTDSESSNSHSSYDEVEWSVRSGRNQKKHKKKSQRTKEPWDQSMRQARSMIKDSKKADDMDAVAQATMSAEMVNMVADLKKQKEDMEAKVKAMEEEKSVLKLEMDRNQREAEKKVANAELDAVKREKDEMAKMIEKLEKAKSEMEGKLLSAKEQTEQVKLQHLDTISQVQAMIDERQALQAKLSTVEMSRDDIHMRLLQAESLSQKLKEEKDEKKRQISEWKSSGNTLMIEDTQRQKRSISKSLKRLEEEKAEMRTMMARMDMVPERPLDLSLHSIDGMGFIPERQLDFSRHSLDGLGGIPSLGRVNSTMSLINQTPMPVQGFSLGRAKSTNMLMPHQIPHGLLGKVDSTDEMLRELEADMMNAHVAHPGARDMTIRESRKERDRPAGWLGDTISNRSFTNLTEMDASRRSHRSGSSRRSLSKSSSKHRHRSRSRSSHGKRSKSREPDSSHSRLEEKRERLRQKEKTFRDEMKRSQSSRSTRKSIDCDASFHSLETGEIL